MGVAPSEWVSKVLGEDLGVAQATPVAPNVVEVQRDDQEGFLLGVVSAALVTLDVIAPFLDDKLRPSFVVNIPKDAAWSGDAIEALRAHAIAFGGMGDLRRAIDQDDPGDYVYKEYAYVERRLRQNDNVVNLDRLYDRVWRVHRKAGNAITVAISNEYDLTADEVRSSYNRYAPFDILFHTNPLGRTTDEASAVAEELGIEIIRSNELFNRLRR